MTNDQRIAEIKARVEAATPGPWETALDVGKKYYIAPPSYGIRDFCYLSGGFDREQDASFIAHAREDIPYLLSQLAASQRRADAAVEDLSTYKDCGFCIHLQDQQYCYKNCQRHVDVDNFRTHPCWQWRGVQAEKGETP